MYKRQLACVVAVFAVILAIQSLPGSVGGRRDSGLSCASLSPVSYTHLVDMKKLTEEYDELEQAHETTYGEFKTVRDDLHRLWKVKSCVDTATRFNERAEEQKLQNRPQTRHKKRCV